MAGLFVVIPCYRVKDHVLDVIARIGPEIERIFCVDDACPEGSGDLIENECRDPRVRVIRHEANQGVGGAMVTGYRAALEEGAEIVVKIDGDGQMDPALIPRFVAPIRRGDADYTKGNRFYRPESLKGMPLLRLWGNAFLSFITKFSSGYWRVFDPTNGLTAIHGKVLALLSLDKVSRRYFFESDMLFRLNTVEAVVVDVPMDARYGNEESGLSIGRILGPFIAGNVRNTVKRIIYRYFLRDFNIASIEFVLGPLLLLLGIGFGGTEWIHSAHTGVVASAGTVMLAALPIIVGTQFLLSAINYDIAATPSETLHGKLEGGAE